MAEMKEGKKPGGSISPSVGMDKNGILDGHFGKLNYSRLFASGYERSNSV